jgi:6-phosphogluconolactonase
MTNLPIEIFPETDDLLHTAADRISSILEARLREEAFATLVLAGGKTPAPAYELLSMPPHRERIDWSRIHFFWGDERCVAPNHPESNYGMAWKALISKIPAAPDHIHRIMGEMEDPEKAAVLYESEIRRVLPGAGTPRFDLVLLGMGEDGHTASLFPGTTWDEERLVVASHMPATGVHRVTLTPRILNEAREVIFMAAGQMKSAALAAVLTDPASNLPAARICPTHGRLTWMINCAAASRLPQK